MVNSEEEIIELLKKCRDEFEDGEDIWYESQRIICDFLTSIGYTGIAKEYSKV